MIFGANQLRKPILFDAKADFLLYGMADKSVVELANALKQGLSPLDIKGLCYIAKEPPKKYILLPSHQECLDDKLKFMDMFDAFYHNNDPISANGLSQKVDSRYLIQNPLLYTLAPKNSMVLQPFLLCVMPILPINNKALLGR